MARRIETRYCITGTLTAASPVHVGGLGGNEDADLALAVDGKGQYYIPGTSLAGALRAWMAAIDAQATEALWGASPQARSGDGGHASFIAVEDAVAISERPVEEIRDGVSLDRYSGTAVERMKYDRAILPRGTRFAFELTLDQPAGLAAETWNAYHHAFSQLLSALKAGHVSIGAAKTRGLGRVQLSDIAVREQALQSRSGILDALKQGGTSLGESAFLVEGDSAPPAQLEATVHWHPIDPVMVKAEGEGIAVDILPLVSGVDGAVTFVLPGTAIKGALRAQAERIVRTVLRQEIPDKFADQLQLSLVAPLFGTAARLDANKQQLGQIAALGVEDCYAQLPLSPEQWQNVAGATKADNLQSRLREARLPRTQQAFHVAVDRWTGGAAEGQLYSALEPFGFEWQPLQLSLNLQRLQYRLGSNGNPDPLAPVALLLFLLRDLMQSRIPLGYGTNRGMGALAVDEIAFRCEELPAALSALQPLNGCRLTRSDFSELDAELVGTLDKRWQDWIATAREDHG
jgi:CRISPR/Cas system CSM-associated protein Csm3 (group 7 of RAMP superfamily)